MGFSVRREKLRQELVLAASKGKAVPLQRLLAEADALRLAYDCPEVTKAREALTSALGRQNANSDLKVAIANAMRRRSEVTYAHIRDMQASLSSALQEAQKWSVGQDMWETCDTLIRRLDEQLVGLSPGNANKARMSMKSDRQPRRRMIKTKSGREKYENAGERLSESEKADSPRGDEGDEGEEGEACSPKSPKMTDSFSISSAASPKDGTFRKQRSRGFAVVAKTRRHDDEEQNGRPGTPSSARSRATSLAATSPKSRKAAKSDPEDEDRSVTGEMLRGKPGATAKPKKVAQMNGGESGQLYVENRSAVITVVAQRCDNARLQMDKAKDEWVGIGKGLVLFATIKPHEEDDAITDKVQKQQYSQFFAEVADTILNARLCTGESTLAAESVIDLCLKGDQQDVLVVPQTTLIAGAKFGQQNLHYNPKTRDGATASYHQDFVQALKSIAEKYLIQGVQAQEEDVRSKKGEVAISQDVVVREKKDEATRQETRAFLDRVYTLLAHRLQVAEVGTLAQPSDSEEEMVQAAIKIQAGFRGMQSRKQMNGNQDGDPKEGAGGAKAKCPVMPSIKAGRFGVPMPLRLASEDVFMHCFTFVMP